MEPRLRAAVFVNLVGMRKAMNEVPGPVLSEEHTPASRVLNFAQCSLRYIILQSKNEHIAPKRLYTYDKFQFDPSKECCYLYHCAFNSLATEAIEHGKLLWKIRPKYHRTLWCIRW